MKKTENLAEGFSRELNRNIELLGEYRDIGPAGQIGSIILADRIRRATTISTQGDIIEMMVMYKELQGSK